MKSVTVQIEKGELDRLFSEVLPGDAVVLTDGSRQYKLESPPRFDLAEDSIALGEELIEAVEGPFSEFSRAELEAIVARVRAEKKHK